MIIINFERDFLKCIFLSFAFAVNMSLKGGSLQRILLHQRSGNLRQYHNNKKQKKTLTKRTNKSSTISLKNK